MISVIFKVSFVRWFIVLMPLRQIFVRFVIMEHFHPLCDGFDLKLVLAAVSSVWHLLTNSIKISQYRRSQGLDGQGYETDSIERTI